MVSCLSSDYYACCYCYVIVLTVIIIGFVTALLTPQHQRYHHLTIIHHSYVFLSPFDVVFVARLVEEIALRAALTTLAHTRVTVVTATRLTLAA